MPGFRVAGEIGVMRVGMDYRPAMFARTGIGRYVSGLSAALATDGCSLRLFGVFRRGNHPGVRRAPAGTHLVAWPVHSRFMDFLGLVGFPADRVIGGCDVFHHTDYRLARVGRNTPQVMTIHDLAFKRDPSTHEPRAVESMNRTMDVALRRCACFLVPSEATARDCEELLGLSRDRLFLTPLGVDPKFFSLRQEPLGPRYLLAVGTIEPRKNYPRLVRAFDRVRHRDVALVIAGGWGWRFEDVKKAVDAAGARDRIRLLGHVGEERLCELMAGATALLYPSLLEGFGLPALEAMAAGLPLLTSNRPPLSDLAGDAALCVDPSDEEAIAAGIERLLDDDALRSELRARGPERARRHTWQECAAATRRAYEAAL